MSTSSLPPTPYTTFLSVDAASHNTPPAHGFPSFFSFPISTLSPSQNPSKQYRAFIKKSCWRRHLSTAQAVSSLPGAAHVTAWCASGDAEPLRRFALRLGRHYPVFARVCTRDRKRKRHVHLHLITTAPDDAIRRAAQASFVFHDFEPIRDPQKTASYILSAKQVHHKDTLPVAAFYASAQAKRLLEAT